MVSSIEDPWSQHDYDVLPCEHEVDAHYHYRLVEHPLQELEKWKNARAVVSGERFADEAHRSWASSCIDQLDSDIAATEEHFRRLKRHRARLRRDRLTLSSSLAPIRALPQDILLEVFSSLVREHGNAADPSAAPWILLRVCHRWRLTAQSSPFLWSTITVTLSTSFQSSLSEFYLKLVEHSLSASRQVPLSVGLNLIKAPDGGVNFATALIATLFTHRVRIRALTCRVYFGGFGSDGAFADAFFFLANSCPMLEELDILDFRHSRVRPAFSCAPNLRRVRNLLDQRESLLDAFSSPSLTHFSCCISSLDDTSILGRMPCLKELHLSSSAYAVIPTPQTPIVHSGVRYFHATFVIALDHFILPSLEVLSLTPSCYKDPRSAIEALLLRSNCALRTLVISDEYVNTSLLDIQELQHLETLALYLYSYTVQVAEEAILAVASSQALPKLKRLILLDSFDRDHYHFGLDKLCTAVDREFRRRKIEKIEMWNAGGAEGDDDLVELLNDFNSKDSERKWELRLYDDGPADAFLPDHPPLDNAWWRWLSDIIP